MEHKLLIANRGEIALRIIRSARKLRVPTVGIYTLADAASPHVTQADEAYSIGDGTDPRGYLHIDAIVELAKRCRATMIAPGYGFLSENAAFAQRCEDEGIIFLGPTPLQISSMGLKHDARMVAAQAGVPIVPGSEGEVQTLSDALRIAEQIGYPVMVKASGGGGGMGMQVCDNQADLIANFEATREKGVALFHESRVLVEKFITRARHIEVQIFGNGRGHVVHAGERECSVQRRHQKVIEESPCVLFATEKGQRIRDAMCSAAVRLGQLLQYRSAGTVEFVLDMDSPNLDFYFLEVNARIQVEHGITEAVHPGLDLVELMIRQGMSPGGSLDEAELNQSGLLQFHGHAIEARVYCENPKAGFKPSPGRLHHVEWADVGDGGRIDTWVQTGTVVTPHYDPMIAKIIVHSATREAAVEKLIKVLDKSIIVGPPNNMDYCRTILATDAFSKGEIHTTFLDTFDYSPHAIEVISPGLATTVQDLPGRFVGLGIPRGGPSDMLSFQAANILVGNDRFTEALEVTMMGPKLRFYTDAVIAVTGAEIAVTLDSVTVPQWTTLNVSKGQVLNTGTASGRGLRAYIAIKGGITNTADFLGSKSTFEAAGLGGHQGRSLLAGDLLEIKTSRAAQVSSVSPDAQLSFPVDWEIETCVGPQWDLQFITKEGMDTLLDTSWTVTPASNRSGLRLEGPRIQWARQDGGEGGSHPSNVVDQGYAFGSLNVNGDTPVLFGVDAPDMGGFACVLAVASGSHWKLGQVRPGDTVRFVLVSNDTSSEIEAVNEDWLSTLLTRPTSLNVTGWPSSPNRPTTSVLHHSSELPERVFRSAGDSCILYEVGDAVLDIQNRVRVEMLERAMRTADIPGIINYNTCIRSCLVQYDTKRITRQDLLRRMIEIDAALGDGLDVRLDIHVIRLPVVLDDKWCQEAVDFYMHTSRAEAVYLPSNTDYVGRNNGGDKHIVFDALTKTPWVVMARGFFAMLPFIVLDPRRRLLAQKYNPSRTRTPEGAIGLAGVVGSIYPIASAGGYQLLGRTLSTWQAWAEEHSIVENFDQIEFFPVSEDEFTKNEQAFKAGSWKPEKRKSTFSMRDYLQMMEDTREETALFKQRQLEASRVLAQEEEVLFAKFTLEKASKGEESGSSTEGMEQSLSTKSPLSATVYKILIKEGDVIETDETPVVELEAMKTSVMVSAGEGTSGKTVQGIPVKKGDTVSPGTPLVYLA